MPEAMLVFWSSPNGRDQWQPVHPVDVPLWCVEDPDRLGRMVAGDMVMLPTEGDRGSLWYRCERVDKPAEATLQ